jgi:hypothetical protein
MYNLTVSPGADVARGFQSTSAGLDAGSLYRAADKLEVAGRIRDAQAARDEAQRLEEYAAATRQRVGSFQDVEGVGSAIDYLQGGIGTLAPTMGPPLAAGLAGAAAGAAVAGPLGIAPGIAAGLGGAGAAAIPAFQMEAGEQASSQAADPWIMANTTAEERLREQNIKGAQNAALESLFPAVFGGRVVGRAANRIAGQALKNSPLRRTMAVARETGIESGTELSQTLTGQASLSRLNPNRDTTHDYVEQIDSIILGALGGSSVSLGTTVPGYALEKAGQRLNRAADEGARDLGRAVGEIRLKDLRERNAETGIDVPLRRSMLWPQLTEKQAKEFGKRADRYQQFLTAGYPDRAEALAKDTDAWLREIGATFDQPGTNILYDEGLSEAQQGEVKKLTLEQTTDEEGGTRLFDPTMNMLPERDVTMQLGLGANMLRAQQRHVHNNEIAKNYQLRKWINEKRITPEAAEAVKWKTLDKHLIENGSSLQDMQNEATDMVRNLEARANDAKRRAINAQEKGDKAEAEKRKALEKELRAEIEALTGSPDKLKGKELLAAVQKKTPGQLAKALSTYTVAAFPPGTIQDTFTQKDADAQRRPGDGVVMLQLGDLGDGSVGR